MSTITTNTKPKSTTKEIPLIATPEIELRAYYIAQTRQINDLPGDKLSDWLKAESQLLEELKGK